MRALHDIGVYENIPILVRSALNVPLTDGSVSNEYRLRRAVPTLRYLAERHARVIVISHLGEKGTETLAPVAKALGNLIPRVSFFPECTGPRVREAIRKQLPGEILVLENLRRSRGETANDPAFAEELAALADVFVQDSFDTCHRAHASMVGVPTLLPAYAGLLVAEEVATLSEALRPATPSLAIIGGAKFSTKEPVLTSLLGNYTHVAVGGALANDFLKYAGHEVGKSLVSASDLTHIQTLLNHPKLLLPVDVQTETRVTAVNAVEPHERILDVGPKTLARIAEHVAQAKSILWNGPLGNFENGYTTATDALAQAVAASGAHSVVGGGDTIASIEKLGLFSKFSFVSTGGGAMLEFLAHGTLPGIAALH